MGRNINMIWTDALGCICKGRVFSRNIKMARTYTFHSICLEVCDLHRKLKMTEQIHYLATEACDLYRKLKVVRTCILLGFWIIWFSKQFTWTSSKWHQYVTVLKCPYGCVYNWNIHHSYINININWCLCRIEQQGILLKLASKTMYPYVIKMAWRYMDVMTFRTIFMLRWHDMWCDVTVMSLILSIQMPFRWHEEM